MSERTINDVMLDIETFGQGLDSPVLAICAVQFNRADIFNELSSSVLEAPQRITEADYTNVLLSTVSFKACMAAGCVIDDSDPDFWAVNNKILLDSLMCTTHMYETLSSLNGFLLSAKPDRVWAKSPCFDIAILRSLCNRFGVELLVNFRQEACVRTELIDFPEVDVKAKLQDRFTVVDKSGVALGVHDPFYDCAVAIQSIQEVYALKARYIPSVYSRA